MKQGRLSKWPVIAIMMMAIFASLGSSLTARNGVALPPPDAAALFSAKCAKCHGPEGHGVPKYLKKGQKDFTDAGWQKSRTDAQLTKSIAEGKGEFMPAWKEKLSAEEIKALVGLIRTFGKKQ
ncbi:MAG TPA: c-type cytochrome [Blastocatellia bacterium]|nr:c-type cytochrome [Blastocatellia bacterium]